MRRDTKPCPFYGMPCEYVPMAEKAEEAAARIEQLEAALRAILDVPANWGSEVYEIEEIARAALGEERA